MANTNEITFLFHVLLYCVTYCPSLIYGRNVVKVLSFCLFPLLLSGCVVPPAMSLASLMLDGMSYASTGKSVTDHAISEFAAADCALWYGFAEGQFCRDDLAAESVGTLIAASDDRSLSDQSGGGGGLALHSGGAYTSGMDGLAGAAPVPGTDGALTR